MNLVEVIQTEQALKEDDINSLPWSEWIKMPSPENCKNIVGPVGAGLYQIRDFSTNKYIQFGISVRCRKRMKSLFPKPYGSGTRNNAQKREYILSNWHRCEYRTLATVDRPTAKLIEDHIKSKRNHRFNT